MKTSKDQSDQAASPVDLVPHPGHVNMAGAGQSKGLVCTRYEIVVVLIDVVVVVYSPGYPYGYSSNTDKQWYIEVPANYHPEIKITNFYVSPILVFTGCAT